MSGWEHVAGVGCGTGDTRFTFGNIGNHVSTETAKYFERIRFQFSYLKWIHVLYVHLIVVL